MKKLIAYTLVIILSFLFVTASAQNKPGNACYISNNNIYFQLDKRWTDLQKKEFSSLYSIDSSLIVLAFGNQSTIIYDSITWQVNEINDNLVELSKPLAKDQGAYKANDVLLLNDNWFTAPVITPPPPSAPKYSINNFEDDAVFTYSDSIARFYLPGYQKKERVYLSGTFNNWSTSRLPMQKTTSGWEVKIKLAPGKYQYKYIVDGRWIHDPNNQLKENDGQSGYNSVVYCYNYIFNLKGYSTAKKVRVTGSFNLWRKKGIRMNRAGSSWQLPVYLSEGTHAYKFIVDGKWITDPENTNVRTDADGNENSFLGIGDTITFQLKGYDTAHKVVLTGSFNAWSTNELVMNKSADGWELPYVIGAGNYEYKFIVDGKWMPDPANNCTSGTGDFINSCLSVHPNHTFTLSHYTDAENVIVTGSFNNWSHESYRMIKGEGVWTFSIFLKPGKYTYKFIVDGNWMIDPANELWEGNEYDTGNSVLWIEP